MAGLVTQFTRCSVRKIVGIHKTEVRRVVSSKSLNSLVRHLSTTQALRKSGKFEYLCFFISFY